MVVGTLKALARQEAAYWGARPLLLTQADLSCIGFWAKQGFARALDANALVRSLRRASGHTIFNGATPMAQLLPAYTKLLAPPLKAAKRAPSAVRRRPSLSSVAPTKAAANAR